MNYAEEKTIDLKQLLYYVLKRWKLIFLIAVIGVLLGVGFSFLQSEKTLEDIDTAKLNMEKISQYHRANEQYELLQETQQNSVLLNLDSNHVYSTVRTYFLTVPYGEAGMIKEKYVEILVNSAVLDELIAVSGYECDRIAVDELVSITFELEEADNLLEKYDIKPVYAKLAIQVYADNEKTGDALLNVIDAHVMALQEELAGIYPGFSYKQMMDVHEIGHSDFVWNEQVKANEQFKKYEDEILKVEKELSTDDKLYYSLVYPSDEAEEESSMLVKVIKNAIIFAMLFGILIAGYYCVVFVMDDHIKTAHEVAEYGLYPIAFLQDENAKKPDFVDRIFGNGELPNNSKEYLMNALNTLCTGKTVLCGDMQDEQIAGVMKDLAEQSDKLVVTDVLAKDEAGLFTVKESEGAILFVKLWKTTAFDLNRELNVLKQIEKPAKGVVVIRG